MRKPIQIAALRVARPSETQGEPDSIETEIVALCDDGTIWTMFGTLDGQNWTPVARIPQGPVLEDWMDEVAAALVSSHIRKDAVEQVMDDHQELLAGKYHDGINAIAAAKTITDRLK